MRKIFAKSSFKIFFIMFRYLMIKLDVIRIKNIKLQDTLFPTLFEDPNLMYIIKDAFDRFKPIHEKTKEFLESPSLSTTIFDFVSDEKNQEFVEKDLNYNFFGGNQATEKVFKENVTTHFKEAILGLKKMMNLMLNFLNPQNLTYMTTVGSVDGFIIALGLLVRIQYSIAYLVCWYYTTHEKDDFKALLGYKDFFSLIQYFDLMCNQSGGLLKHHYSKFIELYFSQFLWLIVYFKRNHPAIPRDVLLNRIIYQVFEFNLSIESNDASSNQSAKQSEFKSKTKFWVEDEDNDEIDEQLNSFDMVSMVESTRKHNITIHESTMMIELLVRHLLFKGLLNKSSNDVLKLYNKSTPTKAVFDSIEQNLLITNMKLKHKFFEQKFHRDMRHHIDFIIEKGLIKELPECDGELTRDITQCFCSHKTYN